MTDAEFWAVIACINWDGESDEEILAPAVAALSALGSGAALAFQDTLAQKLYALDTRAHAREIGIGAYDDTDESALSADLFLYARCCVVVNGREFYERVLQQPREMPKNMPFDALLSLAPSAFERASGEKFDHVPPVSYETFSNQAGWANDG